MFLDLSVLFFCLNVSYGKTKEENKKNAISHPDSQ
jgi:hypothetical protein